MALILCITGMHRSGTSLAASWLEHCGLKIDDGRLIGEATGNERGHFEDQDFVDLHSSSVLEQKSRSHGWMVTEPPALMFSEQDRLKAEALVAGRNEKYTTWGWKDPRSVLFLEPWKRIIPNLKILLLWRPCHEVVLSLTARGKKSSYRSFKISTLKAVCVWAHYNRLVLAFKNRYPAESVLLPIHHVVENDSSAVELINERLDLQLDYQPIGEIYDPKLLRSQPSPASIQILARLYGIKEIERELTSLSDHTTTSERRESIAMSRQS